MLTLPYNAITTASYAVNSSALASAQSSTTGGGFSYASFLIGAVGGSPTIALQPLVQHRLTAGYKSFAPYVADTWKATSKLTIDMGLRWDYMQPYHELKNHFTFMNPSVINPSTNTAGALQFAGDGAAGVFCNCKTPVQTDWKNLSPRLGIAYSVNPTLVIRGGRGRDLLLRWRHREEDAPRAVAAWGPGSRLGIRLRRPPSPLRSRPEAAPDRRSISTPSAAYLGSAASSALGLTYPPTPTSATLASEANLNAGNYLNSDGNVVTASSLAYEDPVYAGPTARVHHVQPGNPADDYPRPVG